MRSFKKKVIISENSTPEARAERLKKIRNMANLTREQLCNDDTININTYKGWEIARYGGLPMDGASLVINRVSKEGVICTPEWLIYGIGIGPYVLADYKIAQQDKQIKNKSLKLSNQLTLICNEILLFKNQFSNTIDCQITDDALSPTFTKGDFVAGIKFFNDLIVNVLNQNCIIQLRTGEILVRNLRRSQKPNSYMLLSTNPNTTLSNPTLYDVEVSSAAPILRHYKLLKK